MYNLFSIQDFYQPNTKEAIHVVTCLIHDNWQSHTQSNNVQPLFYLRPKSFVNVLLTFRILPPILSYKLDSQPLFSKNFAFFEGFIWFFSDYLRFFPYTNMLKQRGFIIHSSFREIKSLFLLFQKNKGLYHQKMSDRVNISFFKSMFLLLVFIDSASIASSSSDSSVFFSSLISISFTFSTCDLS